MTTVINKRILFTVLLLGAFMFLPALQSCGAYKSPVSKRHSKNYKKSHVKKAFRYKTTHKHVVHTNLVSPGVW